MEFVFPAMGIRFIAVNDGYDSDKNLGMTGGMDVAFKNLIYQMYSRDLSRKVKSARQIQPLWCEISVAAVSYMEGMKIELIDVTKEELVEPEIIVSRMYIL